MTNIIDNGPAPFVTDIESSTLENENYRTTLWTGYNLQVTLMAIQPGHDIGLEIHETHDQFLRIEQGQATVAMGPAKDDLKTWDASENSAIFVPAGTWHDLTCVGETPLKLYSVYAPPQHPHGTVHITKEDADRTE
jgi:mannose-6-phosphate isomerase-like protein (cupin superfamily)